jgi:hypothetical protein
MPEPKDYSTCACACCPEHPEDDLGRVYCDAHTLNPDGVCDDCRVHWSEEDFKEHYSDMDLTWPPPEFQRSGSMKQLLETMARHNAWRLKVEHQESMRDVWIGIKANADIELRKCEDRLKHTRENEPVDPTEAIKMLLDDAEKK